MNRNYLKVLSISQVILGLGIIANSKLNLITGYAINTNPLSSTVSLILGTVFIINAIALTITSYDIKNNPLLNSLEENTIHDYQ